MNYKTTVAYAVDDTTKEYVKSYPISHVGAIYTKDDESELLKDKLTNIDDKINDTERVFLGNTEPTKDGLWFDTTDQPTEAELGENSIVTELKGYVNNGVQSEITTARGTYANLGSRLNNVDSSLSENTQQLTETAKIRTNDIGTIVGFMGDSHTEGVGVTNIRHGYVRQTVHLVGTYYTGLNYINAGIAGQTSTQMRARFDSFISQNMGLMVLEAGANDASQSVPLATYIDNMTYMIKEAQKRGIPVVCLTVPPKEATASNAITSQLYIVQYNEWLKRWCPHNNVVLVDIHAKLVNTSDGTLITAYSDSATMHINDLGHGVVAIEVAKAIRKVLGQSITYPTLAQIPQNLCTNGFMVGTGTLPDGWVDSTVGAIVEDTTGQLPSGRWLELTLPTNGTNTGIKFILDNTKYAIGDILALTFICQILDNNGNWFNLSKGNHTAYIAGSLQGASTITQSMDYVSGIQTSNGIYTINPVWLTGTVIDTSVKIWLNAQLTGTVASKARFGAVQVLNLTKLGLVGNI